MQYSSLSNVNITAVVDELEAYLASSALPKGDAIRTTFAVEEALLSYQTKYGIDTAFSFICGKKWGRPQFSISIGGLALNPFEATEDEEDGSGVLETLMGKMGLFPTWTYTSGKNVISMILPKVSSSPLKNLGLAVLTAVIIYAITLLLPATVGENIYTYGVTPISDVFLGLLSALSGPLIFCSIVCSISSMGDIGTFGKIGKATISTLLIALCMQTILACSWLIFVYPPSTASGEGGGAFFEIYQLLLDIIPTNILGVFVDNNPMQIVALGVVTGISLLALQKKTALLTRLLEQGNSILQYIMGVIAEHIHIYVFLSILGMLLSGQLPLLLDSYVFFLFLIPAGIIAFSFSLVKACVKSRVHPLILLKKISPSFFIALSTGSSSAAFSTTLSICKDKLGISPKLADFGVPFGQVIYMPGSAFFLSILSFYMCNAYGITISISTIILIFLLCIILSIALPPIPGGGLIVLNILFLQLGIPDTGLSFAIIASTLFDFPDTALNVSGIQMALVSTAKDLHLLDEKILKNKL